MILATAISPRGSRAISLAMTALALATGCRPADPRSDGGGQEVIVFAAASLQDSLDAVLETFREDHPNTVVRTSYAASSTLAQQIETGAGAHLFISANEEWVAALREQNLIERATPLLGNQLVVIVPTEIDSEVHGVADLARPGIRRLALADPDAVPAGVYAKQALTRLGLWSTIADKVVSAADVRQALSYVESGAAEAGIVYATDAAASQKVRIAARLEIKLSEPIVYPLALTRAGQRLPAAEALYAFLLSDRAIEIFRRRGFLPPPSAKE